MSYIFTTEEIRKKFASLPEVVKDIILDADEPETLISIAKNNGLRIDQMDDFFRIVKHSSIGLIPYNKIGDEMIGVLKINKETAEKISKEIDTSIFSKIRNAILSIQKETTTEQKPPPPPSNVAPTRPPMSPFINVSKADIRFAPIDTHLSQNNVGIPNYSKPALPQPTKFAQNPPVSSPPVPRPPSPLITRPPFKKEMEQKLNNVAYVTQKSPPTSPQSENQIPNNQESDLPVSISQPIQKSALQTNSSNQNFSRGKFGQATPPNFGGLGVTNVNAIPKFGNTPISPVFNVPKNVAQKEGIGNKISDIFKSHKEEKSYEVDPYKEPAS